MLGSFVFFFIVEKSCLSRCLCELQMSQYEIRDTVTVTVIVTVTLLNSRLTPKCKLFMPDNHFL